MCACAFDFLSSIEIAIAVCLLLWLRELEIEPQSLRFRPSIEAAFDDGPWEEDY